MLETQKLFVCAYKKKVSYTPDPSGADTTTYIIVYMDYAS